MIYTIGEMAKALRLPTSTLRFYDKKGLLPFIERSKNGIRMFTNKDLECLRIIECLKQSGMSLEEIKEFISMVMKGDETIDQRLAMFERRKKEVEEQIEGMKKVLDTIKFKCWYYQTAKEAGSTQVPENMPIDKIPIDFQEIRKKLQEG